MNPIDLHVTRQAEQERRTALALRVLQTMAPYGQRVQLITTGTNGNVIDTIPSGSAGKQTINETVRRKGAFGVTAGIGGIVVSVIVSPQDAGKAYRPMPDMLGFVCNDYETFADWFTDLLGLLNITPKKPQIRPDIRSNHKPRR